MVYLKLTFGELPHQFIIIMIIIVISLCEYSAFKTNVLVLYRNAVFGNHTLVLLYFCDFRLLLLITNSVREVV